MSIIIDVLIELISHDTSDTQCRKRSNKRQFEA